MTQQEITHVTVVSATKGIFDYQRGDIGYPLKIRDDQWILCCPGCGNLSYLPSKKITQNEDGTVSSTQPLHCHGAKMRQRFSIDHNEVTWL
jgi:hypothetical protein